MQYQCELEQQNKESVLCVRTRTAIQELPQVLGAAYGKIMGRMGELGENPLGPPYVAYFNMDMQDLDIEIGFPTAVELSGKDDVQPGFIPAGACAVCIHIGPYSEIEPAYNALNTWIKEKGYEAAGPAYEFYLNDPNTVPPEQLQTRIVFPLKA